MERWIGRTAVVTGAGGGIGAAISYQLLDAAVNVVALDENEKFIENSIMLSKLAAKRRRHLQAYKAYVPGALHCLRCDVRKEDDIVECFKWVQDNAGGVNILINCAGLTGQTKVTETNTEEWRRLLEVNVLGLSICTSEAVLQMRDNGFDDGHIVHISSIAGHRDTCYPGQVMYGATNKTVRMLSKGLRKELVAANHKIRITEINPGLVVDDELVDANGKIRPHLYPEDIADTVIYALSTPPHVQIHKITVKPVGEEV